MDTYFVINVKDMYLDVNYKPSLYLVDACLFETRREARDIARSLGYIDFMIERATLGEGAVSTHNRIEHL